MTERLNIASTGGLSKSNISSLDNPLAHPNPINQFTLPQRQVQYSDYPPFAQPTQILSYNMANSQNQAPFSNMNDLNNNNYNSEPNRNFDQNQIFNQAPKSSNNYLPLEAYKKPLEQSRQPELPFNNFFSPQQNQQDFLNNNNDTNNFNQQQQSYNNLNKKDNDIRFDLDLANKAAYKRALDQQVAEKELLRKNLEKARIKSELDIMNQYPFGRRTDPSFFVQAKNNNNLNNISTYQPSFVNEPNPQIYKLNKDNIVEKPNSLNADVPPYDPIKHRNGYHQGYNYDPWGKPGGGAPLVDSNTGRKFTKYTGQVWYDHIGLSPDDRAKFYNDRNRPLTLEEQKQEMEAEKQRKRFEEASYKSRTGDLASWIQDLEKDHLNKIHTQSGAHLPHTTVTREKINQEYARRTGLNDAAKTYHDELGLQLEERNRMNKLYKLRDDVAGIEHTKKWDDWWGKPGGGAPNPDIRRKDLKETLDSPRDSKDGASLPVASSHLRLAGDIDGQYLFSKGTIKSNHKNMYENQQPMKL